MFSFAHNKSLTQNSRRGKRTTGRQTDRQAIIPRLHDCSERSCHVLGSIDLSCECQDVAGGQESSRNSTIPEKTSTSTTRGAEQGGRGIQNNIVLNCHTFDLQLDQKFVSNKIDSIITKKYIYTGFYMKICLLGLMKNLLVLSQILGEKCNYFGRVWSLEANRAKCRQQVVSKIQRCSSCSQ